MQVSKRRRSSSGSTKLDYYNSVGLQVGSKHLISHIVKAYLGKDCSYLSCLSLESLRLSRKVGCVRTNDSFRVKFPFTVSTSFKNESVCVRKVPFTVSTSLKNESVSEESSFYYVNLVKKCISR